MASAAVRRLTERWVRTPSDRFAVEAGCYFDEAAADKVCEFIERFLCHSAGEWAARPFLLQAWQRDYLSRLYGWKKATGYRRFRESYLEVPKKNGKSTLFAGLALYGIFEEPGAEVYIGARNRKQAGIVFKECARMVRASPQLSRHLDVVDYTKTVTFKRMNAKLTAWTADVDSEDGANASTIVLDEVHRFPNRSLYDIAKYAGRARRQPLLISITTAGYDRFSLCYSLHKRSRAVLDGTTPEDFEFLPVLYGADPEKDDLDDPATWRKANPSLGVIFDEDSFRADYQQAKRIPGQLNNFLRLSLNIWTEQATRWLGMDLWDAGLDPVEPEALEGLPCYAALDLSSVKDLTSLSLVFVIGSDVRVVTCVFMPEETATERAENDGVPYPQWIEERHLIETPGNATDYDAIRAKLVDLRQHHEILKVGIDPWNAAQLTNDLIEDEFDVVEVRQGYPTLTGPSKELERLLLAGRLKHDGNPVLRWAVGNVATETDPAGNIKPSKRRSTERIDPVVSMIMAIGLATTDIPQGVPTYTILKGSPG